jgi:hypothetical protein
MTTITCQWTKIPNFAARGLVHAGMLARYRVSA